MFIATCYVPTEEGSTFTFGNKFVLVIAVFHFTLQSDLKVYVSNGLQLIPSTGCIILGNH